MRLVLLLALSACAPTLDTADTVDRDGDGSPAGVDCDDGNADVHPDALEICDHIDNDCNGEVDERDGSSIHTWHEDLDGDGFGGAATDVSACDLPEGMAPRGDDCDDNDPTTYPAAPEPDCGDPVDHNCDGRNGYVDNDGDGFDACEECDDDNAEVNPNGTEVIYDGLDNDCDPATRDDDLDADGYPLARDCDDSEPLMNPGKDEKPYDGLDNDCDPSTPDDDVDGDGFLHDVDCDDQAANAYPGGVEVLYDGLDNDCDPSTTDGGPVRAISDLLPGELVLTEVMYNPGAVLDTLGEWFEVHNPTADVINLQGLELVDLGGSRASVSTHLIALPGSYTVLANSDDPAVNGGFSPSYVYRNFVLANSSDEIILRAGSVTLDQVAWDNGVTFPKTTGAAMQLDPTQLDAASNDLGTAWCDATQTYGAGDLGTPGQANTPCGTP